MGQAIPSVFLEVAVHDEDDFGFYYLELLPVLVLHAEHLEVVVQPVAAQVYFLHILILPLITNYSMLLVIIRLQLRRFTCHLSID